MLAGKFLKKIVLLVLFFFFWFCTASNFSFGGKDLKKKVENRAEGISEEKVELSSAAGVLEKPGEKKNKKKFPWLFLAGGVVAAGVVILLLAKKKRAVPEDEWLYTGPVDVDYDTEVLGIEWAEVPAGEFLMGDNFTELSSIARPVHAVYLDHYCISKYEVTFDQYEKFCADRDWNIPEDEGWGRGNRPVIHVTWLGAKKFCDWLSQKTGKNIHLPTEAQWEKAARGTDQRRYPWGNAAADCSFLNYGECVGKTMPVGSYPSGVSPYGVFDMSGNVAEWCQDYYSDTYYSESPYRNPQGPSTGGSWRVLRGGALGRHTHNIPAASRTRNGFYRHFSNVGFRIVCETPGGGSR
jgi:formylglycine-generating enzyme required for sulfatase activity